MYGTCCCRRSDDDMYSYYSTVDIGRCRALTVVDRRRPQLLSVLCLDIDNIVISEHTHTSLRRVHSSHLLKPGPVRPVTLAAAPAACAPTAVSP